jgi:hypothetical protein
VQGFGAEACAMESARAAPGHRLHVVAGLQWGSLEILQQVRAQGLPYIFVDRAYFGGGPGSGRFRLACNAYQKHWVDGPDPAYPARLTRWGVKLQPWHARGEHLLLVPPGPAICRLFELGDWEATMLAELRRLTRRPVVVSYKGDPKPLSQRLDGCHAVITWTSNVAVEAIVAGVPAFVAEASAARPVARPLADLDGGLESPLRPGDNARLRWAESLAAGQWTLDEIAAGAPARALAMDKEAA